MIRVLYRLRSLSEQSPFDVATFSYASPLLSVILSKGGIALEDGDDPLEQVTLTVDIVKFHAGECEHHCDIHVDMRSSIIPAVSVPAYPRRRTCEDLLHVIKSQPKLAKEAASALIEIGQSMQSTATPEEVQALLQGTLQQEVYVRNACLQTLQVRLNI